MVGGVAAAGAASDGGASLAASRRLEIAKDRVGRVARRSRLPRSCLLPTHIMQPPMLAAAAIDAATAAAAAASGASETSRYPALPRVGSSVCLAMQSFSFDAHASSRILIANGQRAGTLPRRAPGAYVVAPTPNIMIRTAEPVQQQDEQQHRVVAKQPAVKTPPDAFAAFDDSNADVHTAAPDYDAFKPTGFGRRRHSSKHMQMHRGAAHSVAYGGPA